MSISSLTFRPGAIGTSKIVQEALRVTLVEAGDLSKIRGWSQPDGYSNRVSSITNASKGFLEGAFIIRSWVYWAYL